MRPYTSYVQFNSYSLCYSHVRISSCSEVETEKRHYLGQLLEEKAKLDLKAETEFLIAARTTSKASLYWKKIQGNVKTQVIKD